MNMLLRRVQCCTMECVRSCNEERKTPAVVYNERQQRGPRRRNGAKIKIKIKIKERVVGVDEAE